MVDGALQVGIQHYFDGADQLLEMRLIAQATDLSRHRAADALKKLRCFAPDGAELKLYLIALPALDLLNQQPKQVRIKPTAQATIARYDDDAYSLDRSRNQKRMPILRVRVRSVSHHITHFLCIRAPRAHALLRLAHLAGRDHLHRTRDFLRVLDARDLAPNFFAYGHGSFLASGATRFASA